MPKVSVIIPIYGVEEYIERCARHLFEQTLDDIEFIFINDCTPDNSMSVLLTVIKEYPLREDQIIIVNHDENKGLPSARKTGISYATGDYIIHCDSDDWVDFDLYEKMYNKAVAENSEVVICNSYNNNGDCNISERSGGTCHNAFGCINEMMHGKMWWSLCNKMFRRNCYTKDISYPTSGMGEDMCLTLQLFCNCKKVSYYQEGHYYYYVNPISIVNLLTEESCIKKFDDLCKNIEIVREFYIMRHLDGQYKNGLSYIAFKAKHILHPLLGNSKYYYKWLHAFNGVEWRVLLDRDTQLKDWIVALTTLLRLFPVPRGKYAYLLRK